MNEHNNPCAWPEGAPPAPDTPCKHDPNKKPHPTLGYIRWTRDGITDYAHRWAWIDAHGEIPEGHQIDHLCRDRTCIALDHLESVPATVNKNRGGGRPRKSHCKRGHELSEENVYLQQQGKYTARKCKLCAKERDKGRKRGSGPSRRKKTPGN